MIKFRKRIAVCISILIICLILIGAYLIYTKKILLNHPTDKEFPINGIDISHYQGEIDWSMIEDQNVDFAFIKATEGSGNIDKCFKLNWKNAQDSDLAIGAYHFFSFDSSVETQADNYIKTVGNLNGKLPPVIDFEYYGDKEKNPPEVESTRKELRKMLSILEKHYGAKPIIYATLKTYRRYLKEEFDDYVLWIRNVYYSPNIDMKDKWKFWQYTDKAVLKGYSGDEKYIDMNVFNGTEEDFVQLLVD